MAAWDLAPDAVRAVIGATGAVADRLAAQATTLRTDLDGAEGAAGSGPVGPALAAFRVDVDPQIDFVIARTDGATAGAARAVQAYVDGDVHMAANAQDAAATAGDAVAILPLVAR